MKSWKMILIVFISLSFTKEGYAEGFEAAAGLWWVNPEGNMSSTSFQSVNLRNELNFDRQLELNLRLKTRFPDSFNLYLKFTPIRYDETGLSSEPFVFGNTLFSAESPLDSELSLYLYDVTLFYRAPLIEVKGFGTVSGDVGADARFISTRIDISQQVVSDGDAVTSLEETARETSFFPLLYLGLDMVARDVVSFEIEAWIYAFRDDNLSSLIGKATLRYFDPALISVGYRDEIIDFDRSDIDLDSSFTGPFVEVGVGF